LPDLNASWAFSSASTASLNVALLEMVGNSVTGRISSFTFIFSMSHSLLLYRKYHPNLFGIFFNFETMSIVSL